MSADDPKALVRRLYEGLINDGNLDIADELLSAAYVDHETTGVVVGPQHVKQAFGAFLRAFSDLHLTIEDQIAEGQKVVTRYSAQGRHTGTFMGIAPTGRTVTITGIWIDRLDGGRVVENWDQLDWPGLRRQLSASPAPARASDEGSH